MGCTWNVTVRSCTRHVTPPTLSEHDPGSKLDQPDVIFLCSMPRLMLTLPKGLQ